MPGPVFLDSDAVALRTIEAEDLDFLQEQVNDPSIWRAIGRSTPVNGHQEQEFFQTVVCDDDEVTLLVTAQDTPVGMCSLSPKQDEADAAELGYWIASEHRQAGYGRAAAGLLTDYGFKQRGYHRIAARVFAFNEASMALLESLGFVREGRNREAAFVDGQYWDVYWYSVLEGEWEPEQY